MTVTYGVMKAGELLPVPPIIIQTQPPVHEAVYELVIKTEGIEDPEAVLNSLVTDLPKAFNLKVQAVEVDDSTIRIQVIPNQFTWVALLMFLPQILLVLGVVVTLISVYLIATSVPPWLYIMLTVGALLWYAGSKWKQRRQK